MKRSTLAYASFALAFAVPTAAQPPTPGPEQQHLVRYWAGDWTYEIKASGGGPAGTGTITWKPFGNGFFLRYDETHKPASGPAVEVVGIIGYDSEQKMYFWHRYWSNGYVDAARGWLHGATYTFDFGESRRDGRLERTQAVMTEEGADRFAFRWQRSVEGQPWEVTAEGRATRAK